MEDWQEMALITIIVLLLMTAYFVYLGIKMMSLKDSASSLIDMQQIFSGSQGSSPISPFYGIIGGFGR
jgi:hypothetical protein